MSQSAFSGHGWGTLTVTWGSQCNGGSERAQERSLLFIGLVTVRDVGPPVARVEQHKITFSKLPDCWHVQRATQGFSEAALSGSCCTQGGWKTTSDESSFCVKLVFIRIYSNDNNSCT